MKLELFPNNVIKEYDLHNKVDSNAHVHRKVRQGMYRLPQAWIIAQDLLKERLLKAGQNKVKSHQGTGLISGDWSASQLSLMILALNTSAENTFNSHLINMLKQIYDIEED